MTGALRVAAPAKVNLGLRIVGRRDDGYHRLESLFAPLGLGDTLEFDFEAEPGVRLAVVRAPELPGGFSLPPSTDNLVTRAVEGFAALAGWTPRLSIRLEKRVPLGAGLGGGSSDAGAVLRILAARGEGEPIEPGALLELATRLGADVPFFLDPRPTRVSGIGERLEPVAGLPPLPLVLVNPGEALATAEVFAAFAASGTALTGAPPGSTMRALEDPFVLENPSESSESTTPSPSIPEPGVVAPAFDQGLLDNDLEAAATSLCPAIAECRRALQGVGARWVGMSGSGATVYGIFEDPATAAAANERLESEAIGWSCVTQTTGAVAGRGSTRGQETEHRPR